MASLRRSKTMPGDGQTSKFLYTIIKQLDLKTIDWNLVASQLDISNGHAARMRFSRFRQHMEGIQSTPRAKKTTSKSEKGEANGKADGKANGKADSLKPSKRTAAADIEGPPPIKKERADPVGLSNVDIFVKSEPGPEPGLSAVPPAVTLQMTPFAPVPQGLSLGDHYPLMTVAPSDLTLQRPVAPSFSTCFHTPQIKPEPMWTPVKMEPKDDRCDIFVKMEPAEAPKRRANLIYDTMAENGSPSKDINRDEATFLAELIKNMDEQRSINLAKVAEALGYTSVGSVANRFRLLKKKYDLKLSGRQGPLKSESSTTTTYNNNNAPADDENQLDSSAAAPASATPSPAKPGRRPRAANPRPRKGAMASTDKPIAATKGMDAAATPAAHVHVAAPSACDEKDEVDDNV
ncbi:hypothetical protein VTN02DRAFT_1758 [Thermoascus thermophilus]